MEAPGLTTDNTASAAGQGAARGLWKGAIQQVQDLNRQQRSDSLTDDVLSLPSIIQERQLQDAAAARTPRLAVLVHRALHLPGSSSPSNGSSSSLASTNSDCYYVRAGLHTIHHPLQPTQQQKTEPMAHRNGHVCWGSQGLLQLEPHGQLQDQEVLLQLKRRMRLTGRSVLVGSARVRLDEVMDSPKWGTKQQLQLTGHKVDGVGTLLEVQLFLSTSCPPSPLRVLAATWNVGNAMPPPPEQLQAWLKGAAEGAHHLIAVAAQECNYTKEMRRFVSQHRRSSNTGTQSAAPAPLDGASASPTAAKAAAAATQLPQPSAPAPNGTAAVAGATATTVDAPPPPAPTAAAAAAAEGEAAEVVQEAAEVLQEQCSAGVDTDVLLNIHRPGSLHAALKAKLVDALNSSAMWERHISNTIGNNYWLVCSKHMFQTRLLLFARADVVPSISDISSAYEATGIGHVGVNKGGVGIGLKVGHTHIAFVGCHLAAHQSKTAQRNMDVAEICQEMDLQQSAAAAGADVATGFHHVVCMGDLNYRLEYGQQAITQSDSPTPEDFASLCDAIKHQSFEQLLPLDQLTHEREAGRIYTGFREGRIHFPPTFKVQKGEPGFAYTPKRSPAWCDRVLFKSALPHRHAFCERYFTVPEICSSDHKPVAAVLSLPLATNTVSGPRHSLRSHPASPGTASPLLSTSPESSRTLSPVNSWGAAALARLSTFSMFNRRSNASNDATLYKLYLAAVSFGDQATWDSLAALADSSSSGGSSVASSSSGTGQGERQVSRSSSSRRKLQLQLVLSGSCMAGIKHQHVMRLNPEAVCAARTAEQQPSLLLRENSIQLLPGPLSQLTDDMLLVQVVLAEGWRSKKTLARGILPLQPVVSAYRSSYKAVPVTLQLESSSAAAGSLVCTVQLISSASIRAGMHEAIRRMRKMAEESRSTSQNDAETAAAAAVGNGVQGSRQVPP